MWTLLLDIQAWDRYRQQLSKTLGLDGISVEWGPGPKDYPCLVCSTQKARDRLVSAYVYRQDATLLLGASPSIAQLTTAAAPAQSAPQGPTARDGFKTVAAHLLTFAHICVETGLCTPEKFETWYNEHLAMVDQVTTAERDRALANSGPFKQSMVKRLENYF